jgi:4-amino-4-deoxy-L-arabinose transferase-like glycosyltransferase
LLTVNIFTQGLKNKKISLFLLSGVLLGVATLVRPVAQYFPLVLAVIIAIYSGLKLSFKLKVTGCLILVFILTILPWQYRNYLKYGHLSLSCVAPEGILLPSVAATIASKTDKPFGQVLAGLEAEALRQEVNNNSNPFDKADAYSKIGIHYIVSDWKNYFSGQMRGMVNMFFNIGTKEICDFFGLKANNLPFETWVSSNLFVLFANFLEVKSTHEILIGIGIGFFLLLSYFLFIYGAFITIREKKYFPLVFILLVMLYFSGLTGSVGLCRHMLPITPFYLLISARGIAEIFKFNRGKKSLV